MATVKVDMKVINTLIKAIDTHVELINKGDLYVCAANNAAKKAGQIETSVEYLLNAKKSLQEVVENKEIQNLKRNAYQKYCEANNKYLEGIKTKAENLKELKETKELALQNYIAMKSL